MKRRLQKPKLKKDAPTGLSWHAAATELGIGRETLRRKMRAIGIDDGARIRWRDVMRSLVGDKAASLARRALADAEMAEHEVRVATGEVVHREEVVRWIRDTFAPVRELTVAMPSVMAARVNPTDPAHARAQLEEWTENFLRHCRERVPSPTEETEEPIANSK